jgi:hypothetical protein
MIALICAGCSSGSGQSAGSAATSGTATGTENATHREQAVRFAECMRANGVPGFPDPDASGELTIDAAVNGASLDPGSAAWKGAIGACKDLQPPGFTGHRRTAQQQKAALAFARCMRDNGVPDFPDPAPDAPLVDTNRIPSAAGRGARSIPGLDAAMQTCGRTFAGELGLRRP